MSQRQKLQKSFTLWLKIFVGVFMDRCQTSNVHRFVWWCTIKRVRAHDASSQPRLLTASQGIAVNRCVSPQTPVLPLSGAPLPLAHFFTCAACPSMGTTDGCTWLSGFTCVAVVWRPDHTYDAGRPTSLTFVHVWRISLVLHFFSFMLLHETSAWVLLIMLVLPT